MFNRPLPTLRASASKASRLKPSCSQLCPKPLIAAHGDGAFRNPTGGMVWATLFRLGGAYFCDAGRDTPGHLEEKDILHDDPETRRL